MIRSCVLALLLFMSMSVSSANNDTRLQIKQKIVMLAKQTSNLTVKPANVRAELDQLVSELQTKSNPVDETLWIQFAPGSWRQIWSDERDNSPPGSPALDLNNVYQVLRANGQAVNFGIRLLPDGKKVTFVLEAVGSVQGNIQQTKILKGFYRNSGLISGESLELLANDILSQNPVGFAPINLPQFPNGPIGASSPIQLLYLDENLKIGTAPNAFTGASELFIVEKVASVN